MPEKAKFGVDPQSLSKKSSPSAKKRPPLDFTQTIADLKKHYPDAHCELDYTNAFELLIATILSAQCTDVRVNIVTKVLFAKFPTPEKMAQANVVELEQIVRPTGFFKNKARNIKSCAQSLVQQHGGEVPRHMDQLQALAGVGRKTANVVLGNAFEIASGVVVDTHVGRLSRRFGWTKSEDPVKVEVDLQNNVGREDWILLSHLLIWHGRAICKARGPLCESCFLFDRCPRIGL